MATTSFTVSVIISKQKKKQTYFCLFTNKKLPCIIGLHFQHHLNQNCLLLIAIAVFCPDKTSIWEIIYIVQLLILINIDSTPCSTTSLPISGDTTMPH